MRHTSGSPYRNTRCKQTCAVALGYGVKTMRTPSGFAGLVGGDSELQSCGLEDGTERSDGWVTTG